MAKFTVKFICSTKGGPLESVRRVVKDVGSISEAVSRAHRQLELDGYQVLYMMSVLREPDGEDDEPKVVDAENGARVFSVEH